MFESLVRLCKSLPILAFVIMDKLVIRTSYSQKDRWMRNIFLVACNFIWNWPDAYKLSQSCFTQVKLVRRSTKHHPYGRVILKNIVYVCYFVGFSSWI